MVDASLCLDTEKWGREYVPMPSRYILSKQSFLYEGREELVRKECEIIKETQLDDGSFYIPWLWYTEYKEFEVAKNWWKSQLIIDKLLFLKNFGELC